MKSDVLVEPMGVEPTTSCTLSSLSSARRAPCKRATTALRLGEECREKCRMLFHNQQDTLRDMSCRLTDMSNPFESPVPPKVEKVPLKIYRGPLNYSSSAEGIVDNVYTARGGEDVRDCVVKVFAIVQRVGQPINVSLNSETVVTVMPWDASIDEVMNHYNERFQGGEETSE